MPDRFGIIVILDDAFGHTALGAPIEGVVTPSPAVPRADVDCLPRQRTRKFDRVRSRLNGRNRRPFCPTLAQRIGWQEAGQRATVTGFRIHGLYAQHAPVQRRQGAAHRLLHSLSAVTAVGTQHIHRHCQADSERMLIDVCQAQGPRNASRVQQLAHLFDISRRLRCAQHDASSKQTDHQQDAKQLS